MHFFFRLRHETRSVRGREEGVDGLTGRACTTRTAGPDHSAHDTSLRILVLNEEKRAADKDD